MKIGTGLRGILKIFERRASFAGTKLGAVKSEGGAKLLPQPPDFSSVDNFFS